MHTDFAIFSLIFLSFMATSEVVTVMRAIRAGKIPTGVTFLGVVLPNAKFILKAARPRRFMIELWARSVLVVILATMIVATLWLARFTSA
jgi:hypothetical protein